jgi:NAD(P)H dehydrogenase (quinone)
MRAWHPFILERRNAGLTAAFAPVNKGRIAMFAITGITGQVGGVAARALLGAGRQVRAVVRDAQKGGAWAERGCEVALATMTDAAALTKAFSGAEAVFILPPSEFDPAPGFPEARAVIDATKAALAAARPGRVVCLSTVGAQAEHTSLLTQRTLIEQAFASLPMPVAFLRPAWFLENAAWDVAPARDSGILASFLQPLDKPFAMVATEDVGRQAAALLLQTWTGQRVVELEGPRRVTPNEIAATFANILGRPVLASVVPRDTWAELFKAQGMKNPEPRMRMLDGFNEGWIDFAGGRDGTIKGQIELETVLHELIAAAA